MRKAIAVIVALGALALGQKMQAQEGGIRLGNFFGGVAGNPVFYLSDGNNAPVGTFVQVLGGPEGGDLTPLSIGGSDVFEIGQGLPAALGDARAGFFVLGPAVIPGVAPDETAEFQMRAWRGAADFASASEQGVSSTWTQVAGSIPEPPQTPDVPNMSGPAFVVVPEPTTYLLGLLGGAALFLFRRRK